MRIGAVITILVPMTLAMPRLGRPCRCLMDAIAAALGRGCRQLTPALLGVG